MPENEFEKKISSEMQELRFKPSENVWLRVEERIREKKKRRIFIVIFLLAGLALLGYWQRNNLFGEQKNEFSKTAPKDSPGEKQKEANSESTKENTVNDKLKDDRSFDDKKDIAVSKNVNKPKKNKDENKVKPVSEKTKIQ